MISPALVLSLLAAAPTTTAPDLCTRLRALPLTLKVTTTDSAGLHLQAGGLASCKGAAKKIYTAALTATVQHGPSGLTGMSVTGELAGADGVTSLLKVADTAGMPVTQQAFDALTEAAVVKVVDVVEKADQPRREAACKAIGAQPVALRVTGSAAKGPLVSGLVELLLHRCMRIVEVPAGAADEVAAAKDLQARYLLRLKVDAAKDDPKNKAVIDPTMNNFHIKVSASTLALADRHVVSDLFESEDLLGHSAEGAVEADLRNSGAMGRVPLGTRVAEQLVEELGADAVGK